MTSTFTILSVLLLGVYSTHGCDEQAVQQCLTDMGTALGMQGQAQGSALIGVIDPTAGDESQKQTCKALKGFDFTTTEACIKTAGCSDTNILGASAQGSGGPKLTWSSILELIKGMCEPGCENMGSKNQAVQNCGQEIQQSGGGDACGALEQRFSCYREQIGGCKVLVTFTENILESSGIKKMAEDQCPGVNLSLSGSNMIVASFTSTLILALMVTMKNFF